MFSKVPERIMLATRAFLLIGWIALIVSLLWTPVVQQSADMAGASEVSQLAGQTVVFQNPPEPGDLNSSAAPKVFWGMIVPVLPLFLMVFGHEAWRRLCPISFVTQIPRMLGFQTGKKQFNRKTGRIENRPNILDKSSWLQKYNYLVQLGFLFVGLVSRLVLANSHSGAFAILLLTVLLAALTVGYLFGGKTWCNYICPVATIQRIYTGTGGLLESKAHVEKTPVSKSMCRVSSGNGDQSSCVGCSVNCPDIDLENSYWKSIGNPAKRFTYYSFCGLVLGFYSYFYVHAGNWDYYFSGAWTHDTNLINQVFMPVPMPAMGFDVPKLLSVPLYLIACGLVSFFLFLGMEKTYGAGRRWMGHALTDDVLRHQMFTIAAFLSINAFYIFGGRAAISQLPEWSVRMLDASILFLTSAWLWKSWGRSARLYAREGMALSLSQKLKTFEGPLESVLDGRRLEELSADEIYSLAKSLPDVLEEQKTAIYEKIVAEKMEAQSPLDDGGIEELDGLADLRRVLSVSDADHEQIVVALETQKQDPLDIESASPSLSNLRLHNYRSYLSDLVEKAQSQGHSTVLYMNQPNIRQDIQKVRARLRVSPDEHDRLFSKMSDKDELKANEAERELEKLKRLTGYRYRLSQYREPVFELMALEMANRQDTVLKALMHTLWSMRDKGNALEVAQSAFSLAADRLRNLRGNVAIFRPELRSALTEPTTDPVKYSFREVALGAPEIMDVLGQLVGDRNPVLRSLALIGLSQINYSAAQREMVTMRRNRKQRHWFLALVLDVLENPTEEGSTLAGVHQQLHRMCKFAEKKKFSDVTLVDLCEFSVDANEGIFPFGQKYAELRPQTEPYMPIAKAN